MPLEAAEAVTHFSFEQAGLLRIRAGHAEDSPASGRVLVKLGVQPLSSVERFSKSRGQMIVQRRYRLASPL